MPAITSPLLQFVSGDYGVAMFLALADKSTNLPIDFSAVTTTVLLKVRNAKTKELLDSITCTKVIGAIDWAATNADGSHPVIVTPPYDVAGKGGLLRAALSQAVLDQPSKVTLEAELEATFNGVRQTMFDTIRFPVREQF